MTIFERYVFRQAGGALLIILLSLSAIVWVALALRQLNVLTSQGQDVWMLFKMTTLALPNLKLQFDLYHCQILHGDVTMRLRALMPMVGHVQTASVPERHEPGSGEMNDAFLFAELDRLGYDGFIGCEYNPRAGTREGLGWFDAYKGARA